VSRDERSVGPSELARALQEVLDHPDYRPLLQRELLHRANVGGRDRPAARELIRRWVREGRLQALRGGRLAAVPAVQEVEGVLERAGRGFARVVAAAGGENVLVPARLLAHARPGDRVVARVLSRGRDGGLRGVVDRVVRREGGEPLGVFRVRGGRGQVLPLDPSLGRAIDVPPTQRGEAEDGHIVRFQTARGRRAGSAREARVLETLGHLDDPATDTRVVTREFGLSDAFPDEVSRAAARLPAAVSRSDAAGRERFDEPAPVTIDGETARDFDDAVAVQALPAGGFRLFVHIADVAHFVEPGGQLDDEARQRGTSVYFPDRVLPMFPERLSTDLCSLRPGVDRLVQSAILDVGPRGKLHAARFADGIIRSAARLTYTQVANALEGEGSAAGIPEHVLPMLRVADRLREVLEHARHARGSIDFDLPEPQILLDVEGVMTGITVQARNRAHRMIEEFMLLANEAVAGFLERAGGPCLYRIHEPPAVEKLQALGAFVEHFGLTLRAPGGAIEPAEIQRLLESVEGRPEYPIVSQVALRSMKQARYAVENSGHFGLASATYCHFTSPIRRYPDLVVHRQLRERRDGRQTNGMAMDPAWLAEVAVASSERERNAEAAERELLSRKKVTFISGREGESFDGVVTGVTGFGLFVQLVDNLVEGLVRVEQLGEEWFEHDAQRMELRGSRSGRVFRLGDRLRVRVDRVDRVLQRVDLSPDEPVREARTRPGRRSTTPPGPATAARRRRPDRNRRGC
jgi:ribonuclease R